MKLLARNLLLPVCLSLVGFVLLSGFRPFSNQIEQTVQGSEQLFAVRSHAELYVMVRIENDGAVHTDKWLLMYAYDGDATRGIWRILPENGREPTTLLSIQKPGEETAVFLKQADDSVAFPVEGDDRDEAFGKSDWNIEDIYDDDKHDWHHRKIGTSKVRGVDAIVIESHYSDPEFRSNSKYSKRHAYLARDDKRFLQGDYYGVGNQILKTLYAAHHENVNTSENPRIRAKRLEILDFVDGSITVMVRVNDAFDIDIPPEWFTVEWLNQWNAATDQKIIAMMGD